MENNQIACPKCGTAIDVSKVLAKQVEDAVRQGYETKLHALSLDIEQQQANFNEQKQKLQMEMTLDFAKRQKESLSKAEADLRRTLSEENKTQLESMQKELQVKSEQVKELNKAKADIQRLQREKDETESRMRLEMEEKLTQRMKAEKEKMQQQVEDGVNLKLKEKEKTISDLNDQISALKRKAEQGSMQLQGEVQEIEIEQLLTSSYPMDEISEIRKGARGADCIQLVRNNNGSPCGRIYYESKRTKHFESGWLQKLKDDNLSVRADVLVLVTATMPDGQTGYHMREGVWICRFSEVRALSAVLRFALMRVEEVAMTQHGRETKMELLYNYLTGPEFKNQMTAIIEGFNDLYHTLDKEKRMMQRSWAEREKQIEKVLSYTNGFVGSITGIAGKGVIVLPELGE